jgi:hypothetical protein
MVRLSNTEPVIMCGGNMQELDRKFRIRALPRFAISAQGGCLNWPLTNEEEI